MKPMAMFSSVLLLAALTVTADVPEPFRTSTYDWQCEREDGTLVSGHQQQHKATVACQRAALAEPGQTFYIRGGTYRVSVPAPAPTTTPAALSWEAPTQNTDGSPLTNLDGFKIYVRLDGGVYGPPIDIPDEAQRSKTLLFPTDGKKYFFAMTAYNTLGEESVKTGEVSKVMQ